MPGNFSIQNKTRREAPRVPFAAVAGAVLPHWEVSLAFVGAREARALNEKLRSKSYVPNVLSYEVGSKSGEVIICLSEAAKQAPDFGLPVPEFVLFLFIHGCLHLKGYPHGATMERREKALLARFAHTNVPTHHHRHRHRHLPGKTGGSRRALG